MKIETSKCAPFDFSGTRFFFTPWCKNSFKRRLKKDTSKLPIALTPAATKQERERNKAQKKVDTVKSDGYGNVD